MSTHDDITQLPADHHDSVDWPRLRAALRLQHPLRTGATLCTGILCAPLWSSHAALPVSAAAGPGAAFGAAVVTGVFALLARASSRRPAVRWIAAVTLVAITAGTIYAAPDRDLIATWIMEH